MPPTALWGQHQPTAPFGQAQQQQQQGTLYPPGRQPWGNTSLPATPGYGGWNQSNASGNSWGQTQSGWQQGGATITNPFATATPGLVNNMPQMPGPPGWGQPTNHTVNYAVDAMKGHLSQEILNFTSTGLTDPTLFKKISDHLETLERIQNIWDTTHHTKKNYCTSIPTACLEFVFPSLGILLETWNPRSQP